MFFFLQGNELAVGNIEGTLSVFKGKEFSPWKKCSDLGMVNILFTILSSYYINSWFLFFANAYIYQVNNLKTLKNINLPKMIKVIWMNSWCNVGNG